MHSGPDPWQALAAKLIRACGDLGMGFGAQGRGGSCTLVHVVGTVQELCQGHKRTDEVNVGASRDRGRVLRPLQGSEQSDNGGPTHPLLFPFLCNTIPQLHLGHEALACRCAANTAITSDTWLPPTCSIGGGGGGGGQSIQG